MTSRQRIREFAAGHYRKGALGVSACLALAAGACSADVARFDFPAFSLTDNGSGGPPATTSALPTPSSGVRSEGAQRDAFSKEPTSGTGPGGTYVPPKAVREPSVRTAALPEPAQPSPSAMPPESRPSRPAASAATSPSPTTAAKGEMIEVHPGDTLYGLSKKHHVSIAELMSVNGLKSPDLKPGQKLHLPAGKAAGARKPVQRSAEVPPSASPVQPQHKSPAPAPAANWDGSYTVKQGDSLYAVSRRYGVSLDELQKVNAIADVRKVRPGTVLKVPAQGGSGGATVAEAARAPAIPAAPQAAPIEPAPRAGSSMTPTIINGADKQRTAALEKTTDAPPVATGPSDVQVPPLAEAGKAQPSAPAKKGTEVAAAGDNAAGGAGKLRWPAKGKVIANFGPRTDGTHNDGVNLAVPMGTDIHAAESGVVAYAGSELKGYGNLVLVRHDNGWVTAYAHNDQILVKRGDKVKRGQVIGKAGKSGQVDQPQVHFELRQGSKPVDPTPFMESL